MALDRCYKNNDRRVLITVHGTLVRYDPQRRSIHHEIIGSHPANLFLKGDQIHGLVLWSEEESGLYFGGCAPDAVVVSDRDPTMLTPFGIGPDTLSLVVNGRYIAAEPDGRLKADRRVASDWETFMPLSLDELETLQFILRNRWVRRFDASLLDTHEIELLDGFRIRLGDRIALLRETLDRVEVHRDAFGAVVIRDLIVIHSGWKMEHYVLFKPICYLVAYGREDIIQCAATAISSLFEFGKWRGDIMLITDRNNEAFKLRLPEEIRDRVHLSFMAAYDMQDFVMTRYKLEEIKIFEQYQPIIYLDTDIVCDAPLEPNLIPCVLTDALQVFPESPLGGPGSFFGEDLFVADGVEVDKAKYGINSGAFVLRRVEDHAQLFRALVEISYRFSWSSDDNERQFIFDQPFLNYVLAKSAVGKSEVMQKILQVHANYEPILDQKIGKGLVHFLGGVGNAQPKLVQMREYVSVLRTTSKSLSSPVGADMDALSG